MTLDTLRLPGHHLTQYLQLRVRRWCIKAKVICWKNISHRRIISVRWCTTAGGAVSRHLLLKPIRNILNHLIDEGKCFNLLSLWKQALRTRQQLLCFLHEHGRWRKESQTSNLQTPENEQRSCHVTSVVPLDAVLRFLSVCSHWPLKEDVVGLSLPSCLISFKRQKHACRCSDVCAVFITHSFTHQHDVWK